jgi:hypothetical protein
MKQKRVPRRAARLAIAFIVLMTSGLYVARLPHRCDCAAGTGLCAMEPTTGEKNFFLLREYYGAWHDGLFGSRHYREGKLRAFLRGLMGREITTEHEFMLASPEGIYDKNMVCIFPGCRWLNIHGELDVESVKKMAGMDYASMKGWWRSGVLVALTGKVKNFKLDWDAQGDTVHLYLEKVTVLYDEVKK